MQIVLGDGSVQRRNPRQSTNMVDRLLRRLIQNRRIQALRYIYFPYCMQGILAFPNVGRPRHLLFDSLGVLAHDFCCFFHFFCTKYFTRRSVCAGPGSACAVPVLGDLDLVSVCLRLA